MILKLHKVGNSLWFWYWWCLSSIRSRTRDVSCRHIRSSYWVICSVCITATKLYGHLVGMLSCNLWQYIILWSAVFSTAFGTSDAIGKSKMAREIGVIIMLVLVSTIWMMIKSLHYQTHMSQWGTYFMSNCQSLGFNLLETTLTTARYEMTVPALI